MQTEKNERKHNDKMDKIIAEWIDQGEECEIEQDNYPNDADLVAVVWNTFRQITR